MLKNASCMANRKWQIANGKWQKPGCFAIYHFPFTIRPAFFSGLLGLYAARDPGVNNEFT
jgi:hypothetical protein